MEQSDTDKKITKKNSNSAIPKNSEIKSDSKNISESSSELKKLINESKRLNDEIRTFINAMASKTGRSVESMLGYLDDPSNFKTFEQWEVVQKQRKVLQQALDHPSQLPAQDFYDDFLKPFQPSAIRKKSPLKRMRSNRRNWLAID